MDSSTTQYRFADPPHDDRQRPRARNQIRATGLQADRRALCPSVELGQAPLGNIKSVNYLLVGIDPIASAGELADMVRARIPGAQIDFQPNPALQPILDKLSVRFDDRRARQEWGWVPQYSQEQIVDDFLSEMRLHPHRYV